MRPFHLYARGHLVDSKNFISKTRRSAHSVILVLTSENKLAHVINTNIGVLSGGLLSKAGGRQDIHIVNRSFLRSDCVTTSSATVYILCKVFIVH